MPLVEALKSFFCVSSATDRNIDTLSFQEVVSSYLARISRWLIEAMTDFIPESSDACLEPPASFTNFTSASVNFAGTYTGSVFIHCPAPLASLLATRMTGIDGIEEYEGITDAMGELASVLAGNIKQTLSAGGLDIQLSTPSVISGSHYLLSYAKLHKTVTITFIIEKQEMYISLTAERNSLLHAAATELRNKREWLSLALEGGGLGMWDWHLNSNLASYSTEWAAMIGYSTADLLPDITSWQALMPADEWPQFMDALQNHLCGKSTRFESEHRMTTQTGKHIWFLTRGKVVERDADGTPLRIAGTSLDISDRKIAEKALFDSRQAIAASEERLRCITNSAHDAILMMNPHGEITFWNPSAVKLLGFSGEEVIGKCLHSFIVPEHYRDDFHSALPRFRSSGQGAVVGKVLELNALCKDGREIEVALSLASVSINGEWHAVGIMRDISELKRYEAELRQMNELLEQRVAEEIAKNREKDKRMIQQDKLASIGQLAAGVAHEINNPMGFIMGNLNCLKGYADALNRYSLAVDDTLTSLSDSERTHLAELRSDLDIDYILDDLPSLLAESTDGAERIKRIVLDLKDFARPGSNEMQEADLNQLVRSTINIVINELKYVADLNLELGDLPSLFCHPQQINQVITNFLVNAAHAMEQHGIITVNTRQNGTHAVLSITDTGKGIAEDVLGKIFDPFFTTKDVGKGTGLGLSICYDIVKKHQGEIHVESKVGVGTTFTVSLPLSGKK